MTAEELIKELKKYPKDTKVVINEELGWYELQADSLKYQKVYNIWSSDYNNNKTPYVQFSSKPENFTFPRGENVPDFIKKTIGSEFIILLG